MNCARCNNKSVVEIRHEKRFLCGDCFIKLYVSRIRRNIKNNKMLDKKDKVMCAVSNSADSAALLHIMKMRRQDQVTVPFNGSSYGKLFQKAIKLGCTKIAIDRNLDDEARMILLSFYNADISNLRDYGPVIESTGGKNSVNIIKPLRECSVEENILYAQLNNLKFNKSRISNSKSPLEKSVIKQLSTLEKRYPGVKYAVLRNLDAMLPALNQASFSKS